MRNPRKVGLLLGALALACGVTHPPVRVERTTVGVTIDCQSLGEYPSSIGTVELFDTQERATVWRIEPEGRLFQAHRFKFVLGRNPSKPVVLWGAVRAVVPSVGSFIFTPVAATG